jgi:hypothetical protein
VTLAPVLLVVAVGPLLIALGLADRALDPDRYRDTTSIFYASAALPFLVCGAIVATFAGVQLRDGGLFRWATRHPPVAPAVVVAALVLVVPAFRDAGSYIDDMSPARVLAAAALSVALTWAAAMRVGLAFAATAVLGAVLLVVAGSMD